VHWRPATGIADGPGAQTEIEDADLFRSKVGVGGFRGSNELHSDVASALAREAAVPELCAYGPCKCSVDADEMFCGDVRAMLGASLVRNVAVSTAVPLKSEVVPRCACGHDGCGNSFVSREIN